MVNMVPFEWQTLLLLSTSAAASCSSFSKLEVQTAGDFNFNTYDYEILSSVAKEAEVPIQFSEHSGKKFFPEGTAVLVAGPCPSVYPYPEGSLVLLTSPCKDTSIEKLKDSSISLPIYKALERNRFPCLYPILRRWLEGGTQKQSSIHAKLMPSLFKAKSDFLTCGRVASPPPRLLPKGLIRSEQLQLGAEYLNGRHLSIATINRPPFVILTTNENDTILGVKGFCFEIIQSLADKYNFTFSLELSYDGNWGGPMKNGTFNGMVGMVVREWVDMAMASFTITRIRDTVIDFTHPYYEEPTAILVQAPKEQPSPFAFLEPFSYQVWLIILASVCVVGPMLWFLTEGTGDWAPILYPHTHRKEATIPRFLWDTGFALTAQSNKMRLNESSRVLLGVWWTYCIILIYTYTGTLIASLTVPRLASIIESLEALANQRDILWTYRANTAHEKLFATTDSSSTYYKIGQLMREQDLMVTSDLDGINSVLQKNMAYIKEKSFLDFAMERDYLETGQCRFEQVPQLFFSASFGLILQEESVFLPLFNSEILRMMQYGLFTVWQQRYWPKPNECSGFGAGGGTRGPRPLRIQDLSGHFLILGFGSFLAVTCFFLEKLYSNYCMNRKEKSKLNC